MALVGKIAAFERLIVFITVKRTVLTGDEFPAIILVHGVGADCAVGFALCGGVCHDI